MLFRSSKFLNNDVKIRRFLEKPLNETEKLPSTDKEESQELISDLTPEEEIEVKTTNDLPTDKIEPERIDLLKDMLNTNEEDNMDEKLNIKEKEKMLFSYFCDKIKNNKKIITYLPKDTQNCTGIISINIIGYTADEVGVILDEEFDICVRTGYHCSPLIHDFIGSKDYYGTVRISFNYFNTTEDIDKLVEALNTL